MSKARAWLQLFRAPNLLTVPGDPLAGFLIATGGQLDSRAGIAVAASLCLYAAGLAMNDLADLAEDRRERPNRPLASGAISKGAAGFVTLLLIANALFILRIAAGPLAMMGGLLLLATITFYNLLAKRVAILGAVTMGTCRGFSVLLGAAAGTGPDALWSAWAAGVAVIDPMLGTVLATMAGPRGQMLFTLAIGAAVLIALYIAAVTALARHETKPDYPKLVRFLPLGALLIGYLVLKQATGTLLRDHSPTLWVVAIILCAMNVNQLMAVPPPPLAPRIGGFIRIMPILQASLCLAPSVPTRLGKTPDSLVCAVALLACVPLSAWLGKKFYAS
jgi:4-hydroxybenzoate polyprenyltransferase